MRGSQVSSDSAPSAGASCTVKIGRQVLHGQVAGVGTKLEMERLDEQFAAGKFHPSSAALLEDVENTLHNKPPPKKRGI